MQTLAIAGAGAAVGAAWYVLNAKRPIAEEMVVNMVDVGEETGELDTMLYKVADYFDDEVRTMTDGLMKLMEPLHDRLPRRRSRLHRHRAVLAVSSAHPKPVLAKRKAESPRKKPKAESRRPQITSHPPRLQVQTWPPPPP